MSDVEPSPRETDVEETDDPVGYFVQDLTYHGKSERTRDAYERVLREFEEFTTEERGLALSEVGERDCMEWVHTLRGEKAGSTVATYASYLHRFYGYMTQVGVFVSNPMTLVMEEMDESIDTDPSRREISVTQMRGFVQGIGHPLHQAVVVTLLKTGMRVGEVCNLDLRDVALDDAEARQEFGVLGGRGQLDNRPDSVFVASDIAKGDTVNGEERSASNKRKRDTVVPIDSELKYVLKRWLAIRPRVSSPAEPLFVSTRDRYGERLTPGMVRTIVSDYAADAGWYSVGGDAAENVTPHYFRHFFTTHMRDRTGDRGVVKYIRGDVASDIIDTYTHNWGDRVRAVYSENIYQLLE